MSSKVEPSRDYNTLRGQFISLQAMFESKSQQLTMAQKEIDLLRKQLQLVDTAEIEALRNTNHSLTAALEGADSVIEMWKGKYTAEKSKKRKN